MKKINFYAILFCVMLFANLKMTAQQEQSLAFMTDVWQSNLTNPAFLTEKKIAIGLPSVYFNLNSPDLVLNNLVKTGTNSIYLDDVAQNKLQPQTHLNGNVQLQTLGLTFPVSKKLFITLNHGVWTNPSVIFNRNLARIIVKGNADSDFLGKTTSFGSSINGDIRSELGIGAAYKLANLTIGARVKLQYGISAMFTTADKLDITFNQNDYNVRFQNDFEVQTYAIEKFSNITNVQDLLKNGLTSSNKGVSFDLGGSMTLGKIRLNASLIDLGGSIKWQTEGKSYSSKGDFTYKGVNQNDVSRFFRYDSLTSSSFQDTLKKVIGFTTKTSGVTYTQKLPTKIYLSGSYELNDKLTLGALVYGELGDNESRMGFMIDATAKLLKVIRIGATVGLRNKTFSNVGVHISAKLGPIQLFAVTDNILTAFNPYSANNANGRAGLGLLF
jgi:Family of unknown function (DUF5723)